MAGDDAFIAARGIHSVLRGDPPRDDNVSVESEQADASSLKAGGQISGIMRALFGYPDRRPRYLPVHRRASVQAAKRLSVTIHCRWSASIVDAFPLDTRCLCVDAH